MGTGAGRPAVSVRRDLAVRGPRAWPAGTGQGGGEALAASWRRHGPDAIDGHRPGQGLAITSNPGVL